METSLADSTIFAVWDKAREELLSTVGTKVFESWFAALELESFTDDSVTLSTDGAFAAIWVKENYIDVITRQITMAAGRNISVDIIAREESFTSAENQQNSNRLSAQAQRPIQRHNVAPTAQELPASINPRNTFETFVVGKSNGYAHALALAVAQNVGKAYNPLFIYGSTGLGKTHLMHAIAHSVIKNNPTAKIVYVTSENFVNEYVETIKNNNPLAFRKKYRNIDVLLIDDVQFFAGKRGCQEEFFHTFNELFNNGKQIILSCDRPINEVADIEQRLISRFSWGAMADIDAPDYEMRLAILQKKLALSDSAHLIGADILDLIARKFTTSIRRMEGALTSLIGYASLVGEGNAITLDKAMELLADKFSQEGESQMVDIEKIQKKTAEYFKIDPEEMCGRRRTADIALPRQIAMALSKDLTKLSLQEIGRRFGGRDHGTVMHAIKVVNTLMEQDDSIKRQVDYLRKSFSF